MKKSALLFLLLFTIGQTALADIPPPIGYKSVTKNVQIETEKDFSEYSFYVISPDGSRERVEISKDKAGVVSGAGRGGVTRFARLLAVPKKSEELMANSERRDLEQDIANGKMPGAFVSKNGFNFRSDISSFDLRDTVTERYRLESIDAEKGIVLTRLEDEKEIAGNTSFWWIPGGLLSLALIAGGIWAFRRKTSRAR